MRKNNLLHLIFCAFPTHKHSRYTRKMRYSVPKSTDSADFVTFPRYFHKTLWGTITLTYRIF